MEQLTAAKAKLMAEKCTDISSLFGAGCTTAHWVQSELVFEKSHIRSFETTLINLNLCDLVPDQNSLAVEHAGSETLPCEKASEDSLCRLSIT